MPFFIEQILRAFWLGTVVGMQKEKETLLLAFGKTPCSKVLEIQQVWGWVRETFEFSRWSMKGLDR